MNSCGVLITNFSFCYEVSNVFYGRPFLANLLLRLQFCMPRLTVLISQFRCTLLCGLCSWLTFSLFYANPIWYQTTRDKFLLTRANLVFTPSGTNIHVLATKTIHCRQRSLVLPIPALPGSRLCPVSAIRRHLSLNPGPGSAPFSQFYRRRVYSLSLTSNFPLFFRG